MGLLHADLTDKCIRAFFTVYNQLGYGFLEKVYERSMLIELKKLGLTAERQRPIQVFYDGIEVGSYFADLYVEDKIIIELKSATTLIPAHESQLFNYLKATEIELGLLFNFGEKPQFKRKIIQNKNK